MKSGHKTLNSARQNFLKAAVSVNTARPINTAYPRPTVNSARTSSNVFNRAHAHVRRLFNKSKTYKTSNLNEKVNTVRRNVTTVGPKAVVSANKGNEANVVKASACWIWRPKQKVLDHVSRHNVASMNFKRFDYIDAQFIYELNTPSNSQLLVITFFAFRGDPKGDKITGKGKISTGKLDFEDVYFVKELKFNLFSVSQMCDKKNNFLFTETECVFLSLGFKLLDENHVLLRVPRKDNMYSVDLKNIIPSGGLTCLFAKATLDESNLLHRRLGHINFKTMNKLVRGNLVRGLPSKIFENNHTCVACQKGKQHKASCKTKTGIKREISVARTPQQNGIAKRKNRTLIEAIRTMLADSKLLTTFWVEAVNTACYVQNRVLVIKPHNKTPYELFLGRKPALSFMRPVRCPVTILNTLDHLGSGPKWLFNIDTLTKSMNYKPVVAVNQTNSSPGTKESIDAGQAGKKAVSSQEYIQLPLLTFDPSLFKGLKDSPNAGFKPPGEEEKKDSKDPRNEDSEVPSTKEPRVNQEKDANVNSTNNINTASDGNNTNNVNTASSTVNAADIEDNAAYENIVYGCDDDPYMPNLEEIAYSDDDEDVSAEADMNNLNTFMPISPIVTTRLHKDHPLEQIIGDIHSVPQTRRMTKSVTEHGLFTSVQQRINHKDFQNCLFACFLSQVEPKKTLVDLPHSKRAIGTKWVYRNKKDERGIVIRNKARIEAIRLFLAYASFKDFVVYQMDVKNAFLYGKIKEEVYVCQPSGFEDPEFPDRVYKVEQALYGLHQAPRAWYETLSTYLLDNGFQRGKIDKTLFIKKSKMSSMGELTFFLGLQVTQKNDGIFISQDKYVDEILKKFGFLTMKTASTPIETTKPLMKDENVEDLDVHLYRSMIGSLIYLTSSRPDIMFADSLFVLESYTDSDYAGASLDKKSTTGGCQFLGSRLISWQCKKQIVVANSTTEAEYVAASSCYRQVLWIQNQLLDYGYNFMNTKIFSDNESTICIVKNPMFHSKTKHIEIRHHFIRDSYKKRLIQVIKIYTDHNVADLLIKAFDVSRFQYLISKQTVIKEWEDRMERAATTASSLEAEQDSGNINRTQSMETLNESFPQGTDSGSSPRCQDPILGGAEAQIRPQKKQSRRKQRKHSGPTEPVTDEAINEEHMTIPSYDPPQSGEDRMQLNELMDLCSKLSVKKLEKKRRSKTYKPRRLYKGRKIADLDADTEVTLIDETQGRNDEDLMFDTSVLNGDEVFQESMVNTATTTSLISVSVADLVTTAGEVVTTASVEIPEELTLAQTLIEIKSTKPKAVTTTATTVIPASSRPKAKGIAKDKGNAKMVEPEKPLKKKDQIAIDEKVARNLEAQLQAELEEKERLSRQKEKEANIAIIES
ncbi:putative ribonuclease H-like domain-containing protein [Tanacetum coccineum]